MKIGIINRASEASEKTEAANDLEYLKTEAYGELIEYYSSGSSLSEQDYVLQKLGEKDGITVNQTAGTVTYNGKTYNISELLGNSDEQNSLTSNGLTQVTDSPLLTENENIRMVLQEETESGTVQAVIPAGFYYVTGKPSTGLVISDVQGDDDQNTKGGNQFVWVPCNQEGTVTYAKHIYADSSEDDTAGSTADTGNGGWQTHYYRNYNDWTDDGGNATSVEKYGGFYIARYEAGAPTDASFYNDTDRSTYWQGYYSTDVSTTYGSNSFTSDGSSDYSITYMDKNVTNYTPVSKKNTPAWNFISQESAKTVSSKMYEGSSSVTSGLVDSYAWDTTTQWLSNSGYNATDSTTWGNYNNTSFTINGLYARHEYKLANDGNYRWFPAYYYNYGTYEKSNSERTETSTGSVERNKANNIYDLAGNMWEWTTETGKHNGTARTYAVIRGGSFDWAGSSAPVCCRNGSGSAGGYDFNIGFRVVLYIK